MRRKVCVVLASFALLLCALAAVLVVSRPNAFVRLVSRLSRSMTARVGAPPAPKVELTPFEQQVVEEINLARANPQQYAAYLEEWKRACTGNQLKLTGGRTLTTNEGVKAIDEAIAYLKTAQPLAPLGVSKGMSTGAKDHILDLVRTGGSGHRGSDGSLPDQRLARYGNLQGAVAENIAYSALTAREAVLGMIVDDGTPSRGHRLNLFNSTFRAAGVAASQVSNGAETCVIDFAGGFVERAAAAAMRL
ncbi:MAG: CAP domain-containing protein [Pyrinomonadaceae bacterium]